jgi:dipeptidyl aminopeptidase/acylaminoacyl peptidase
MSTSRSLAVLALLAAVPAAAQQGAAPRAFQLADWYKLTTLSSPAMSPSGDRVAVTVTTVREAENKRHSEIWVGPTAGGEPKRFTSPSQESTQPRWSPDGRYLFFTSSRSGGKGNTWAIRMDQPGGEAEQLEKYPSGSVPRDGRFAIWAEPDSVPRADSARMKNDPFAKMQPMARPPYGAITRPANPARFDGRQVVDMRYKSNDRGFLPGPREARTWRPAQLWRQAFDGSEKRKLTSTAYSHRGAVVSPDGRWVVFLADAELRPDSVVEHERDSLSFLPYDAKRDEAPRNEVDLFIMSTDGGDPRRLAWSGAEGDVTWSPDSKRIAFIGRPTRTSSARVYLVNATGGEPQNVLADAFKYEPSGIDWLVDGTIVFNAEVGGSSGLFRLDPATKQPTQLLGGRRKMNGFNFDKAGRKVAYVATSLTKPTELYVADANGKNEKRLTSFNDKLTSEVAFSDAERFTYPSVGGLEIEGWLMKPYGYQPGKKYPVVLYIHGGPHSQYGEGWFDEFQNLAGKGMFVLFTNPRGSSGYGADFTYATRGRWGAEDYEDLMKAVDIVSKRADIDSTRMGVTGGSYGGFMTAWVTTKTNRFKAAETDRMISDWTYWYGASDAQGLTEFEFYGKPWDNFAMYDTLSPIRHVTRVRTPTLMVQSEDDFRTPMGNAELWYMALKKMDVPVELVRYPRSTHELSRSGEPWLLVDRLGRLRQWFAYWLQDKPEGRTANAAGER